MSKRITGYINWHRHRKTFHQVDKLSSVMAAIQSFNHDHLAITGDLVNIATHKEIMQAKNWLEQNCAPETTSLVPGNHDAYVPTAFGKSTTSWQKWIDGGSHPSAQIFPYLKTIGDVAIIGFSTSNATLPLRATGNFTKKQAKKGAELLKKAGEDNLFRIILIHHPPYVNATHPMKKMIGIHNFNQMMNQSGAELILHGHTHYNTTHMATFNGKEVPIIGTASASQIHGDKKPTAGFNLFDIEKNDGTWRCKHQRYQMGDNGSGVKVIEQNQLY